MGRGDPIVLVCDNLNTHISRTCVSIHDHDPLSQDGLVESRTHFSQLRTRITFASRDTWKPVVYGDRRDFTPRP